MWIVFLKHSDRIAYLKMKVKDGSIAIFSLYAPHNMKPLDERFNFYSDLGRVMEKCSAHGAKYLFGDLNARLGKRRPGEDDIIGPHGFGRAAAHHVEVPNRDILIEFCTDFEYIVASTFQQTGDDGKATYFEPRTPPMSPVTEVNHNMRRT